MNHSRHWQLNPTLDFLNHGSFGATPTVVLQEQRRILDGLESDPIRFLAPERELEAKLDAVRQQLARLFHASPENLAFVRNATDGVNAVFRSLSLEPGSEILVTDHGYNACINAAEFAASRLRNVTVRKTHLPFPLASPTEILESLASAYAPNTRLLLIDHVTSPTGLVMPVEAIVQQAHERQIRVLVDGAHAPGMLPLDLTQIDADYYTANHHKWLCGPKVSGFLYVRPELQSEVRPTVISHAANRERPGRSRFLAEFDWTGTYDPSPLLALPKAIAFLSELYEGGLAGLMQANREKARAAREMLCDRLAIPRPAPDSMLGSLVTIPVRTGRTAEQLGAWLYQAHRFELPVFPAPFGKEILLRISLQAYNRLEQVERLADVLRSEA